jgi:EmrB/QacA subfamily drug resistance transporter
VLETNALRWWALGVLCLAVLVVGLDITVLNVALPTIAASLHASTAQLQWIVDSYVLAFAGAMLPAGLLGDRWGRRRMLLAGMALFGAASAWSAFSGSIAELIAARAAMGVGAATIMPLAIAYVPAMFSPADRPRAIGLITVAVAIGLPLGPIVGGALLGSFAWSSVFWINVPLIAVALIAGSLLLRDARPAVPRPADVAGTVLGAASVVALVFAVVHAPERGWLASATLGLLAGAVALGIALVAWERRAAAPLVDPRLLANPRFVWGTVAGVAVSFALYGLLFVVPQFLQSVHGHDALGTGLRLAPLMAGLLLGGGAASRLDRAFGTTTSVTGGLMLLASGLAWLATVSATTAYEAIAAALAVCGAGVGAAMAPAMDAVLAELPDDEASTGAAINNTLRQVGGALGVAVLGSLLAAIYTSELAPSLRGLPSSAAEAARESVVGAVGAAGELGPGGGEALRRAAGEAFTAGMSGVLLACAVLVAFAAIACARFLPARAARPASTPASLAPA